MQTVQIKCDECLQLFPVYKTHYEQVLDKANRYGGVYILFLDKTNDRKIILIHILEFNYPRRCHTVAQIENVKRIRR
jgi:hypothetical protein